MLVVRVRVTAGARREKIEKTKDGFVIAVREKAERNEANERVRAILAREFGVPPKAVRLERGARSPGKIFRIGLPRS